jgi:hypothetical protein
MNLAGHCGLSDPMTVKIPNRLTQSRHSKGLKVRAHFTQNRICVLLHPQTIDIHTLPSQSLDDHYRESSPTGNQSNPADRFYRTASLFCL